MQLLDIIGYTQLLLYRYTIERECKATRPILTSRLLVSPQSLTSQERHIYKEYNSQVRLSLVRPRVPASVAPFIIGALPVTAALVVSLFVFFVVVVVVFLLLRIFVSLATAEEEVRSEARRTQRQGQSQGQAAGESLVCVPLSVRAPPICCAMLS